MVCAGAFFGVQMYTWNAQRLGGDAMPMPLGIGASVVLSGSMEPELRVNDLILVQKRDDYQTGDVVVYQSYGSLIVHRIIAVTEEEVVTQGDANPVADPPIERRAIKGVVVGRVPFVGQILNFLKTPVGVILIIGAAILLLELSFRKEKQEADKDLDRIKDEIRRLRAEQTQES